MRIFAADDSEDARDLMAATLSSGGFGDAHFSESGLELLAALGIDPLDAAAPEADIILLDVRMPGVDGIETCARIRADARYQQTPILMVTSLDDMETLNQAFVAGANDYINKPFNRIEMLARLRNAQRLRGELERRRTSERELLDLQRGRDARSQQPQQVTTLPSSAAFILSRQAVESYVASSTPEAAGGIGVIAVKIDRLQPFHTNFGAGAATALLVQVAGAMARLPARLGDLLAHSEPDVFLAILHHSDQAGLARLAQNARQAMRELPVTHGGSNAFEGVSVSIGVASKREPRACLSSAVSAMERAAGEGGDRILFA
jgi:PleD family two-component response regulator